MIPVDLTKLTIEEVSALKQACETHLATWFGFSTPDKARRIPGFVLATSWRLAGKTEPCCECGEPYPTADLHFYGEIYCPNCRPKKHNPVQDNP